MGTRRRGDSYKPVSPVGIGNVGVETTGDGLGIIGMVVIIGLSVIGSDVALPWLGKKGQTKAPPEEDHRLA